MVALLRRRTGTVSLALELTPNEAAALSRFMEKMTFEQARETLYAHLPADLREEQAYQIVHVCGKVEKALTDLGVRGFPWVETGQA